MPNVLLLVLSLAQSAVAAPAALERAIGGVRAEDICADVRFIASDELEGRDTPSQGLRLAARYLRARLERLGFQPGGDDGFFDRYTVERTGLDLESSRAWLVRDGEEQELVFGQDYAFYGRAEHEVDGPIVFVGAASETDLAGLDLAGKWALVIEPSSGRSRGDGASAQRERGRASWEERAKRAERLRATGALGVLTAPDPAAEESQRELAPDAETDGDRRLARTASWARRLELRAARPAEAGSPGSPVSLSLSGGVARRLLGDAGTAQVGHELGARLRERRRSLPVETLELENVAGLWPGSDPVLAKEVVILSAHYDHEGIHDGQIYNGADDNGSGTCTLLAVAEALARYGPLRRSVLFLWVSGEEKGLLGSDAWARQPTLPEGHRAVCDLNIDMVGRNAPEKLMITPTSKHPEYNGLTRLAESLAALEGFPKLESCDDYWDRSDHASFAEHLDIPVAFLFSDVHEDYHQPGDDAEKIDCDKIRRVSRLVVRMLDALQADELEL